MTEILKCDLCGTDAGNDPYHITFMGDGHVHVCSDCFDPQQHDVGVLKQQRDELLDALKGMVEQFNHHTVPGIVHEESEAIAKARAAIAKTIGDES